MVSAGRGNRFDVVVFEAWERFERNLAGSIAAMPEGTYITITAAQASHGQRGQRPYVDLVAVEDDQIVAVASLPSYLYPDSPDSADADRHLHSLGWSDPGKPTIDGVVMDFTLDGSREDSLLIATTAVATFREIWNVPHPSFLTAWAVGENLNGPIALAHNPAEAPRAAEEIEAIDIPEAPSTALRSLNSFCDLVGGSVGPATVHAICGEDGLDRLQKSAEEYARQCEARAVQGMHEGSTAASKVWHRQARSWAAAAASLRAAHAGARRSASRRSSSQSRLSPSPLRPSAVGQDRPAESTGS